MTQASEIFKQLDSKAQGLSEEEAKNRHRPKEKKESSFLTILKLLKTNFISPINLLLYFTAFFSWYLGDILNSLLIFIVVFTSALISFIQEFKAHRATQKIIDAMQDTQSVLREGLIKQIPSQEIVIGDVLVIDAGDLIPLDCILFEAKDIFVNVSNLTGESLPQEKTLAHDPLIKMGSCIISGMGKAVVIQQNTSESFGALLSYISRTTPLSSFSVNLLSFSKLLMKTTLVFTVTIFLALVIFKANVLMSLLFSLSIAVGLSPQLLPAILTTNLAIGARKMAKAGALTKRLDSIENFGNMDILCCDKTGTLTKGKIELYAAIDTAGAKSQHVFSLSFINASLQTGFKNSLDQAIVDAGHTPLKDLSKLDEIPYDFNRKILSIYASHGDEKRLISKGALESILARCQLSHESKDNYLNLANTYYNQGFRVLGLASKILNKDLITVSDEQQMTFEGFLLFYDPLKEDTQKTLSRLRDLGIRLIMITGDHPLIASFIAQKAGFYRPEPCPKTHFHDLSQEELKDVLANYDVFARIEPLEKAKLIEALKQTGSTVGYLGDGINDSGALFTADVGISVESGSEMAKATSDFILMKKNLIILCDAVNEGRKIFNNTIKYVLMAVSANFGNMFSMALVSFFMPFLPLLPTQILLINLLQDAPEMGICTDKVDPESLKKPQKWNLGYIARFMIVFGIISSFFDFATFFTLKYFDATPELFRSAWFTESVISATMIILFIRSKKPIFRSKPSFTLTILVFSTILFTLIIPYTQLGSLFAIIKLPVKYYIAISIIVMCYGLCVEIAKKVFHQWIRQKTSSTTLSS